MAYLGVTKRDKKQPVTCHAVTVTHRKSLKSLDASVTRDSVTYSDCHGKNVIKSTSYRRDSVTPYYVGRDLFGGLSRPETEI